MLNACEHSNCAVCKNIEERDVFRKILKTIHPEVYTCKYAMYKITNNQGNSFLIFSLNCVLKTHKGYFIRDPFTDDLIHLNADNFKVVCSKGGECHQEPYVEEYIPQRKKKSAAN